MRRVDRQMKPDFAWSVLDKASYGVIATKNSYAIPVSPARIDEVIYFHGAKTGKMRQYVQEDPTISLVVVGDVTPSQYDFSVEYESGIFFGKVEIVEDEAEAIEALLAITKRYTPHRIDYFQEGILKSFERTLVFKLIPSEITAKRKKFDETGQEIKGDYHD